MADNVATNNHNMNHRDDTFTQPIPLEKRIADFLNEQHIMGLCTQSPEGIWCANCFYAFDEINNTLYFMSDTHTEHAKLMQQNPSVAATIAYQTQVIKDIRGVQCSGEIRLLNGEAAQHAYLLYTARFPEAKQVNAPLWAMRMDRIKMTDNRIRFGYKTEWTRAECLHNKALMAES